MIKAMKAESGLGLSAPQIGVNQSVIVIDASKPFELINPKVLGYSGPYLEIEEGCLSIPQLFGFVKRPEIVHVTFLNKDKKIFNISFDGMASRIIQHEIDHLNGILFVDRAEPSSLKWKHSDLRSSNYSI
jgi:peptide deformylase